MPPSNKKRTVAVEKDEPRGEGFIELEPGSALPLIPAVAQPKPGPQQTWTDTRDANSRVVYIGNLPHGFYEKQLLGFFSQFGKLTHVRLSRNKKTGHAKHYAFLEFQYPEVAKIAAASMDGYFLFKQRLTTKIMEPNQIHPDLFKGAKQKFRNIPWRKLERKRHDRERTPTEHAAQVAKLVRRDASRAKRIEAAGVEYTYAPLQSLIPTVAKKITFD
eukprot:CAMPEP_0119102190 /NCGR_PEP_ID=MMETSP1180-20130426/1022_1 /TAXON_ID=3052 ORGANISM="Chlamydomonas cf sp, Strain CCMP681" /NCGR_SAMPLE_ID=MMETSP1180 /ASSEMBLY_ACC=CAM_ASM_000741 /LENGTH=216 /DNA_ID=CAMNT_0007086433 /DNA_START=113 /DNA_END=763 /DNA_ORIENTATION=-